MRSSTNNRGSNGYDGHVRRGHPVLLALILLCALVEAIVTSWLVSKENKHHNYVSPAAKHRTIFLVFVSWWTVLLTLWYLVTYLVTKVTSMFSSIGSHMTFLIITWILWIAAAASITAAFGGGVKCHSFTGVPYCRQQDVMIAFAWLVWGLLTLDLFLTLLRAGTALGRGGNWRHPMSPMAQTGPGMVQTGNYDNQTGHGVGQTGNYDNQTGHGVGQAGNGVGQTGHGVAGVGQTGHGVGGVNNSVAPGVGV